MRPLKPEFNGGNNIIKYFIGLNINLKIGQFV